ncbi:hypothetical protein CYY_001849 [Polysphondylium violaceum]|uniref:DUF7906 domain-containing protein n=1 Tax=Polysphondylium violaceum TaxID=133409 RepID=A0A8J4PZE1_9MYCE|nr:hypothetical protein CYY_001849 [Polysphondylium violaceum]
MKINKIIITITIYIFLNLFYFVNNAAQVKSSTTIKEFDQIFQLKHDIKINIKLIGFDSLESEELEKLLNHLDNENSPSILYPKVGKLELIKQKYQYNVSLATQQFTDRLSSSLDRALQEAFEKKIDNGNGLGLIAYDVIDDLLSQEYRISKSNQYTLYLLNLEHPERSSHIKSFKYTYSQLNHSEYINQNSQNYVDINRYCTTKMWQSKAIASKFNSIENQESSGQGRYTWIDLGADISTYGPLTKGTGTILPETLPQSNNQFIRKLLDIAGWIHQTSKQLITPPIYWIPEHYGWEQTEIQLIMVHDHKVGIKEVSERLDWEMIQEQLKSIPLATTQKIIFTKRELSLLDNVYVAQAKQAALRVYHSGSKGTQQYLDSKELHIWLKQHLSNLIPNYDHQSNHLIVPVFVFDISYKDILLLDRTNQAVSFQDMVIAIQTQTPNRIRIDFQCDKKSLSLDSTDATKPILSSLLQTIWGITPTHLVLTKNSKNIDNNYLWSFGNSVFSSFSTSKELSFSQTDSAIRNLLYFHIQSSLQSLRVILDHIYHDETWDEFMLANVNAKSIEDYTVLVKKSLFDIGLSISLNPNLLDAFPLIYNLHDLASNMSMIVHDSHRVKHSFLECEKPTFLWTEFLCICSSIIFIIFGFIAFTKRQVKKTIRSKVK